jgi:hypothetical protein
MIDRTLLNNILDLLPEVLEDWDINKAMLYYQKRTLHSFAFLDRCTGPAYQRIFFIIVMQTEIY